MNEDLLRIDVATCVRMLEYLGLIDFSGHVSCRIPGMNTILINPWGASRHSLGPQDIVKASLSGEPLEEGVELPLEIHIHTSIYRRRPDVNAVTHLHPPVTTALSVAGKDYVPVIYHGAIFGAGVSVYDDCSHVNTVQKGDALAAVLGPRRAAIMRGHGAVVAAESVKGAFLGSVYLEDNAKMRIMPRCSLMPIKWASHACCGKMNFGRASTSGARPRSKRSGRTISKSPAYALLKKTGSGSTILCNAF
jgi:L-fuculose-phosphate aldolase